MPSIAVRICSVLISLSVTGSLLAGDLNPPGAPASTPGPEPRIAINQENTPGDSTAFFRIREPGSYYLEQNRDNILGSDRNGILIEASDVTVDLNGFTLDGYVFPSLSLSERGSDESGDREGTPEPNQITNSSLAGIRAEGELENIVILNGTVRDWNEGGIDLSDDANCTVRGVRVIACGGDGIVASGESHLQDCIVRENEGRGCVVGDDCEIISCMALNNGDDGFRVGDRAVIRDCVATDNGDGVAVFPSGFQVGWQSVIVNCVADGNDSIGIVAGFGCVVEGSTARGNGYIGISVSSGSSLTGSVSVDNQHGISIGNNCRVVGCTANENLLHGIWVSNDRSIVENNVCADNGSAGINVVGVGNRIDGNHVTDNRNGVRVVGNGNFIIRNTASGNTGTGTPSAAYDFEASFTSHGPIVTTSGEITSVNPWANFNYVSPL